MALFTQLTLESGEFIGISIQVFLSQSVSVEIRKFIVPKFSCLPHTFSVLSNGWQIYTNIVELKTIRRTSDSISTFFSYLFKEKKGLVCSCLLLFSPQIFRYFFLFFEN